MVDQEDDPRFLTQRCSLEPDTSKMSTSSSSEEVLDRSI